MDSEDHLKEYLEIDAEIWPEAPIGPERLIQVQKNSSWTAFIVRDNNNALLGSVMAWVVKKAMQGGLSAISRSEHY
ncbi:hypothetical protein DCC85_03935 [Paenibacillus sp. CAA11]|uniref:hypothetical protein n=1 Tax=Paenibacillus sp. CAA11 TaxID=1532905 RepID=UPI000D392A28|nr:hypothetical protein [Paenibacillus sp. CAA11]AWB43457.1 hypothetical protein DCC85_03935 [Paenibacillus sp. CAA11]